VHLTISLYDGGNAQNGNKELGAERGDEAKRGGACEKVDDSEGLIQKCHQKNITEEDGQESRSEKNSFEESCEEGNRA